MDIDAIDMIADAYIAERAPVTFDAVRADIDRHYEGRLSWSKLDAYTSAVCVRLSEHNLAKGYR